ncbi:MAG TPA: hypothetical protein VK175_17650 [Leadbetterella sp.]|nr:hypothetical protein [Leadbetterella sp.]
MMVRGEKFHLVIFLFILTSYTAFSQETPYYQLPQNRNKNHEMVVMPNLEAFTITYFITSSAGLRKPFIQENLQSPSAATSSVQGSGFWEVTFGQNRNDNWILEFGVTRYKGSVRTSFTELSQYPLVFTNQTNQVYVPFRVKKKVWTIDRVSRNAFLNVGVGASYLLIKQKSFSENGEVRFQQRPVPEANDYTSFEYALTSSRFPIAMELLTELRGKVSERLEISIFSKVFLRNAEHLKNAFTFNYVDGTNRNFDVSEKPLSLVFGLQAKLNSPKYYSYKSRVD